MYKLVKVITNDLLKTKDGKKEFRKTYYAIELENGKRVVIKPCFEEGYSQLDLICEKRFPKEDR